MKKEYQNYLKYLFFRKGFIHAFMYYLQFFHRIFFTRIIKIRHLYYPSDLKKLVNSIKYTKKKITKNDLFIIPNDNQSGPVNLKLTSINIKIDSYPDWNETFEDPENTLSLNRWNWLLSCITDNKNSVSSIWGTNMIKSYINHMTALPNGIRSESYTVAERISNLCIFYRSIENNWTSIPNELQPVLLEMSYHLIDNLEFHNGDLTGNHIVNNARALIVCGYSINQPEFVDIGKMILLKMLPKLVDQGGFLREGSSHYQFLFSRWMLELRIVGEENKDFELLNILNSVLFNLIEACKFFIITNKKSKENRISLIGDVSPDCDPNWLIDMPFSKPAQFKRKQKISNKNVGWSKLFNDWESPVNYEWDMKLQLNFSVLWTRIDFEDWIAIFHHETPKNEVIASHSHYDFGSFVLYYKGNEIIIDPGRINYIQNYESNLYLSPKYHSTISLNDLPIVMRKGDRFYSKFYISSNFKKNLLNENNKIVFSIEHDGLSRINSKKIFHTRVFKFTKSSLNICDKINGEGTYKMECYFQLPLSNYKKSFTKNEKKQGKYSFNSLGISIEIKNTNHEISSKIYQGLNNPKLGWRSRYYGDEEASTSIIYDGKINLPFEANYEISLNK